MAVTPDAPHVMEGEVAVIELEEGNVRVGAGPESAEVVAAEYAGRARRGAFDHVVQCHAKRKELAHDGGQVECRTIHGQLVQVSRDHIRCTSLPNQGLGGQETEPSGTVADVNDHPGVPGAGNRRHDHAILADHAHGVAVEGVRDAIAGTESTNKLVHRRWRHAQMDHDRQANPGGCFNCAPQRFHAVGVDIGRAHPHLDANEELAVGLDRAGTQRHVHVVKMGKFMRRRRQAGCRDVQVGKDAGARRPDAPVAEAGPRRCARGSCIHPRGNARVPRNRIGINAPVRCPVIDMGVQVNQPGEDQVSGCIEVFPGRLRPKVRSDRRDASVLDRDIHDPTETGPGVDHLATMNNQVVHHCFLPVDMTASA